jgi:hypothetical protein
MRIVRVPYTPITALTTAYATGVTSTGAALALAATAPTDSLAHFVTLTSGAAADLSGVAFTIVGKDADGQAQTETIAAGPNNSTVSGSKYFRELTSVTPSATMATKVMDIGIGAASLSPTIALDRLSISPASLTVDITGTINYTVKDTIADVFKYQPSTLPWSAISALTAKTALTDGAARTAATGVQVLVNSVTNGATYTLWVSQASQTTG